jgi:hypothetical protein
MSKNNEIKAGMTIPQARGACARELRELRGYTVIDYELTEQRYGRKDGQTVNPDAKDGSEKLGKYCAVCPVWEELGECSLKAFLQELAADQRAKFELVNPGGPGNLTDDIHDLDTWYDSGWHGKK